MLPEPANRIARAAAWHWTVRYLVGTVLLGAATVVPAYLLPLRRGVRTDTVTTAAIVLAICTVLAVGIPWWRYAVHRWESAGGFVLTRAGVVFRDWRIVPLNRVQTVEVSQGILERLFGVARLQVRTASYAGSTEIAGLDVTLARRLAATLTEALTGHDDGA